MKIYIASDHGGFYLKEELKKYLSNKGHRVADIGNTKFDPHDDYPDFVFPLAEKVAKDRSSFGVVIGRSGIGEAVAANKVKSIKASLIINQKMAKKAREHNHLNIISFGADYQNPTSAKKILDVFLSTPTSQAQRHIRRLKKISRYEHSQT